MSHNRIERPDRILAFWFDGCEEDPEATMARAGFWYGANDETDQLIETRFLATVRAAQEGHCEHWVDSAHSALALVIVLDQFPRNIWRGTAEAFACDALALAASRSAIEAGWLAQLTPVQSAFLLMPFQHSEDLSTQRESVKHYDELVERCTDDWRDAAMINRDFAQKHFDIVSRFGRFPHRNACLGREPTDAEARWLGAGGESFGQ